MKVFTRNAALSDELKRHPGTCGFVPTMGALHNGHLSLVEQCRRECDTVVVSIFVNPTQFNDPNDLKNYPRTVEADLALLEKAGADFALTPSVEDIYPEKDTRVFDFGLLDYPLQIVACPIVRDTDGLALSSRNALLTPAHRAAAPLIYKALKEGVESARSMSVDEMKRRVVERIDADPLLQVEYFEVVNADTLEGIDRWSDTFPMRGCIAVQAGNVRLIDNIAIL